MSFDSAQNDLSIEEYVSLKRRRELLKKLIQDSESEWRSIDWKIPDMKRSLLKQLGYPTYEEKLIYMLPYASQIEHPHLKLDKIEMFGSNYSALKYCFPLESFKVIPDNWYPGIPVRELNTSVFLSKASVLSVNIQSKSRGLYRRTKICNHDFVAKVDKFYVYGSCGCYYERPDGADYHDTWEGWITGSRYDLSLSPRFKVELDAADFDRMYNEIRRKNAARKIQRNVREWFYKPRYASGRIGLEARRAMEASKVDYTEI